MSDYLQLNDEAVVELILWRLPIKSIIRCRCVCKSWYSLITNPNFISIHLLRKTLTENPQIFLHQKSNFIDDKGSCLLLFDNQYYFRSLLFHVPHPPDPCRIVIVGSVNGLICLSIANTSYNANLIVNFVVFNPSIGHFLSIDPLPPLGELRHDRDIVGFGFDERTQDYIILSVLSGIAGFIYSLNSHCWRRITCRRVPKNWKIKCQWTNFVDGTIFVNGRFHWLDYDHMISLKFIMVFDTKDEAFGRILLPDCVANNLNCNRISITEFRESSIAVVVNFEHEWVTHIWIMKEYGSVNSWIKLTLGNYRMSVLGFRNKDEVLIRCKSGCIASQKIKNDYNMINRRRVKNIMDVDPDFTFSVHKYVPSLVLLDKKSNVYVAAPTHGKRTKRTADPSSRKPIKTAPTHSKRMKRTARTCRKRFN